MSELRELPTGWTCAAIGELTATVTSGSRGWAKYYAPSGALFLRVGNLTRGRISLDLSDPVFVELPKDAEGTRTSLRCGDVLISITADVGMVAVIPADLGEAYINQHVALLRPLDTIEPECFAYSLLNPVGLQKVARDAQYGMTKASLSLVQLREMRVPLPPLPEQRRIVGKIEQLQEHSDAAKAALDAIPGLLEQFRQSVLAAAFRGDLTKTWRQNNPNTEPAASLIARTAPPLVLLATKVDPHQYRWVQRLCLSECLITNRPLDGLGLRLWT